ncbi:hypothetical protein KC19_8G111200 [Ceratodon purpureus]|uniref:Uncharacterized protein n=1 Tax=Ceratodon purpureus TaxID=3225 RepID=A0A8T0H5R6_CERPU|nr:hypothetical protein KC19_8G111200 [Ceratodon purpureus]
MVTSLRRSPKTARPAPPLSSGRQATQAFICASIRGRSVSNSLFKMLSITPNWVGTLYIVSFCRRVSFCMYCRLNFFGIITSFKGRSISAYCFSRHSTCKFQKFLL